MNIDVSVIIINYNTTELTKQAVESVIKYTAENSFEIIVVDNASNDRTIETISELYPDVVFIANVENIGFGRANNLAMDIARGKYFFLLNSDAYLISDSISIFWNFMEVSVNRDVACCGGNLIDEKGVDMTAFGNLPSLSEAISRLGFGILYHSYYRKKLASGIVKYSNDIINVGYITGADMFIRRHAIDVTGGFDKDFFLYFEETELSFRFKKHGFRSVIIPTTSIVHLEGGSQKVATKLNFTQIERFAKSRKLYFTKCHNPTYAKVIMLIFGLQSVCFGILKFNRQYFKVARINFNA